MINEYFLIAGKNIRRRKLRSWLTVIGIIISIATIFFLISVSLGLNSAVQEQFRKLGTDKFFIQPKGNLGPPGTAGAIELTDKDVRSIEKVQGVKKVTYMVFGNAKIEFNRQTRFRPVIGTDLKNGDLYFESGGLSAVEGRILQVGDTKDIGLGYNYKFGDYFSKPVNVGDTLSINDVNFNVKGIISKVGNSQDDLNIYMPVEQARELFNIPTRIDYIVIQVNQGANIKDVADRVSKQLVRTRGVTEKTKDFIILTPEQLLETFGVVLNILTGFLLGVAAISLFVGGIGITNTMYTSVIERTKEIGVMKAVGARNSDIIKLFTIESGLIGAIGGLGGIVIGFIVAKIVEFVATNAFDTTLLQVATPWYLFIGCLVFSFIIGCVAGIVPARHASQIRPVVALRYE